MNDTLPRPRRQRAILSCNDCRRRKLRCDRLDPCNRCIKGGIAHSCAYGPEAHCSVPPEELRSRPTNRQRRKNGRRQTSHVAESVYTLNSDREVPDPMKTDGLGVSSKQHLQQADHDMTQLQHSRLNHEPGLKDQVEFLAKSPELKGISRSSAVMGMLKGRGFGTQFYGASSLMSIVAQFPDLRLYMRATYSNSTARRLSQDIKASEDRARQERSSNRTLTVPSLRSLLPDRSTIDTITDKYFATFETTYRIIHIPTFQAAYKTYWETETGEDVEMDALLLAILACTICTSTHTSPRYNHVGSTFHSKAYIWIKACETWLKRQSNKHRSLVSIQVRCLRLLALATASIKVKEYYQDVQAHVSFMRSAGMHIDPSILGTRCSPYEGEMRRRLWATTMELELQASIDKGTPSMLSNLSCDYALPRNIDDAELDPCLRELPPSRSIVTFTETSFLHLAMQTLELRVEMCRKVNDMKDSVNKHDTLEHEEAVRHHVSTLPRWSEPRSQHARTLLELQLTQFLIFLHVPQALQFDAYRGSNFRYGVVTALEAAARTIALHHSLTALGNYALLRTRNDFFRSSLLICHAVYYAKRANDTVLMRLAKLFFDDAMGNALSLQEERAMRPGRGYEHYWYVSAAVSLVGTQCSPSQADEMARQASDRVAKLLYKVLALQDDPSEETLATEVLLEEQRSSMPVDLALHTLGESLTADSFANAGLRLDAFRFDDASDFMMDDLCFFDMQPLHLDHQTYLDF